MPQPDAGLVVMVTSGHVRVDPRIFHREARTLARAGYRVCLLAPWNEQGVRDGVELEALEQPRGRLRRFTVGAWKVYRRAAKKRADIYHLHDPELLLWAPLLRRRGAVVVYDMHENTPKDILVKQWIPGALRPLVARLYRRLERRLIGRGPLVFAESSYPLDYPWVTRSVVVLNMPQPDDVLARASADRFPDPTVGYMGIVGRGRGSETTIRALAVLEERGRPVAWECVGRVPADDHRRELVALIGELGLEERARLRGWMPPEEGWAVMGRCHAGLAVLDPRPNTIDSYPTKLFEYMLLGIPVVVSDFPLWREVVESAGCGVLVPPGSPEHLADAIGSLLDDPEAAAAMGERGRAAALERYTWVAEGAKLLAFYASLIPERFEPSAS